MSRSFQVPGELHELVARLCDEGLDAAGQARLDELLVGDIAAQAWYVEYVDLHASIRLKMQSLDDDDFALREVQAALSAAPATIGDEGSDQTADVLAMRESGDDLTAAALVGGRPGWLEKFIASPRQLWGAAAAAALLVGAFSLLGNRKPQPVSVPAPEVVEIVTAEDEMLGPAKLSGYVGARWAGAALELPEGQIFEENQRIELVEGLAELTFKSGARVIVQGPAVLEIRGDSSAVMSVGRIAVLTAGDAPEFSIQTAAARLTTRDSEFGADIDVDGSLVTEVYHGQIELKFNQGAGSGTTFQLAEGQGARIDALSHSVSPLTQPYDLHFVRYLPQHELLVNLADVVAGGNGVRTAYHQGISLTTGGPVGDYGAPAQGDGRYIRTRSVDFVDGVFIPNGKLGPVQVDSIGRKFAEFPPTAGDSWGGAIMARRPREEKSLPFIRLEYHGDNYGYVNWLHIASKADELSPEGHGLIGMHSNSGITFDLHAIRAQHPSKKIVRFRSRVGNLESKPESFVADAWVIVDGELRYRRQGFSREDGAETINVPLNDRDRFLVLAVTDVGGNTAYDWVAFGDPIIELAGDGESSASIDVPRTPATVTLHATRDFDREFSGSFGRQLERTGQHDMTRLAANIVPTEI